MAISDLPARIYVESWSPEYGNPFEVSDEEEVAARVDPTAETTDWSPIPGDALTAPRDVAFVDGVRRIEARLTIDDPSDGPVPGILAAFGVGAVLWERDVPRSTFHSLSVERMVVMAKGYDSGITTLGKLAVSAQSVPGDDPLELLAHVQRRMRAAEQLLASDLASPGRLVISDGRHHELGPRPIVGFLKTHRVMYLSGAHRAIVGNLAAGERTPIFTIDAVFSRYSWYVRLADLPRAHSWTGIVRCEVSSSVGRESAIELAGWTAALLPLLASERHIDPRAPQNLVPISAVEKELRRGMGDRNLAHRTLVSEVHRRHLAQV